MRPCHSRRIRRAIDPLRAFAGRIPAATVCTCLALAIAPAASAAPVREPADGVGRTFALVVNGDDTARHRDNVSLAVDVLVLGLGVDAERLHVLAAGPRAPSGPRARYLKPTRANLKGVTRDLATIVDGDDTLVVYTTGHAAWNGSVPVLVLGREAVSARDLGRLLLAVPAGRLIFVADQCFSGAFTAALQRSDRELIAISSTDASHEVQCAYFSRPFWNALRRLVSTDGEAGDAAVWRRAFDSAVRAQRDLDSREGARARFLAAGLSGDRALSAANHASQR